MEFGDYNNDENFMLCNKIPNATKTEPCLMGIDEAGRGPVLGPMVYATSYCPISSMQSISEMGFADSKVLTKQQREELFYKLNDSVEVFGWIINIISPNYISNAMLSKIKYNLNQISHDSAIGLIRKVLDNGVNLKQVFVDTVGDSISYENKLKSIFPELEITVSKKADSIYPIVSAASICAKVARDKALEEWQFFENEKFSLMDYGSGYPGDPKTKQFLLDCMHPVFGFPTFVRFSWSTAALLLDEKAVTFQWEDDEVENEGKKKGKKIEALKNVLPISNFFSGKKSRRRKQNNFFSDRHFKPAISIF